ncbi:MAG: NAD-dependent epimerase/dehydratase family protein [Erysipelotrichaceae bacterium]|nr:NAD-dependent epimerase/dehydratase family protein [Erysipelotrichaceae bacterium]
MSKVLITGGAGFIGSHIVNLLVKQGNFEIRILDNFSTQIHGDDYKASFLYNAVLDKAELFIGDIRNQEDVLNSLIGVDQIIHLAAETGTGQSMYSLNNYTDVNIMGLSTIFEVILKYKIPIKKIILASSRAVYGEGLKTCPHHGIVSPKQRKEDDMILKDFENHCPICNAILSSALTTESCQTNPISYYAYTKLAQEKMIETLCPINGIDYTIFRYYNVYGAGQSLNNPYTGIVSIFSKLLLQDKTINVFEDGLESRDFVHVEDVAEITCKALTELKSNTQIINVGSGTSISVLQVAETLKSIYGSHSLINISGDFRKGDIRHNTADISLLKEIFNHRPHISFEQGLNDLATWVLDEVKTNPEILLTQGYEQSIDELKEANMIFQAKKEILHD